MPVSEPRKLIPTYLTPPQPNAPGSTGSYQVVSAAPNQLPSVDAAAIGKINTARSLPDRSQQKRAPHQCTEMTELIGERVGERLTWR